MTLSTMKLSIASSTLPGDLHEKLNAASRAGFHAMEIFETDLLYSDRTPTEIHQLANELGIQIFDLQTFNDFEGLPPDQMERAIERVKRKFQVLQQLGAETLLITSNTLPHALSEPTQIAADLSRLADLAAQQGLRIAYEPLPWSQQVADISTAFEMIQLANRDNLGLVLDSFSFYASQTPLEVLTPALLARVFIVQLADSPGIGIDIRQADRQFRCFAGQGKLPLLDFVSKLRSNGYQGVISQEVSSEEFRSSAPYQIARDAYRSLLWMLDRTSKHYRPADPQQPILSNIEFIELASQGGDAKWLEQLLVALGFCKTHQHKSKDVVLYRQQEICLVVNHEADSFANAHYELHGTSVCAVGLATPQQQELVQRCRHYRCDFVQTHALPEELDIPAIRTVGEAILYLVDKSAGKARFYEVDFVPLQTELNETVEGIGLNKVDHVTQAVSSTEFLSIIQFYSTLFELEASPEHDLVDRNGIVHSRSLVNSDESVRLPINSSHARESSTERFRARFSGSGIQHIAFSCDDIFTVAEQLNTLHILPVSPNYYAEIQSDFLLDDELISRMKAHNILYDADHNGHFFHIYTRHINGLFFEIVQRNQYHGFGERNAAARLAAQAREYQKQKDLFLV